MNFTLFITLFTYYLQASKILSSLCWGLYRTVINNFPRVLLFLLLGILIFTKTLQKSIW